MIEGFVSVVVDDEREDEFEDDLESHEESWAIRVLGPGILNE